MKTAHLPPGAAQGTVKIKRRSRRTSTIRAVADTDAPSPTWDLEALWDRHGASVYTLAYALLGDETTAARAMRLGMHDLACAADCCSADDSHRSWSHHVYLRSQELLAEPSSAPVPAPTPQWLGHLAQVQRACLALCLFGGHTYREVASLLDLQPMAVADLLTTGLGDGTRLAGGRASSA
ncbi:MAG: polymerase sigma-70 factor, subfamily [Nocardioides sp.]|jgi:hypothetical protein|uniref:hypothetical protein n=1 Tax=Nocardioides sp. TaxID=35761 RepID=UPI0026097F27|nr:hypothetical protein [Nocardioides sp.]MCW2834238.1 polymerase sigma-70 factor, subfamily [Nocardioides sp.]